MFTWCTLIGSFLGRLDISTAVITIFSLELNQERVIWIESKGSIFIYLNLNTLLLESGLNKLIYLLFLIKCLTEESIYGKVTELLPYDAP